MASIRVSDLYLDLDLEDILTLCLEACVREIVRFGPSFTNLQLGFFEVFPLFILFFCARSHSSSRWPTPCFMGI